MTKKERADAMGDRLKAYETVETDQRFPPNTLIYARLDGRSFSKFTKGLARPWDGRLSNMMIDVTKSLVKEFNALTGYTQSDEISLIFLNKYETPMIFDGKKQKLLSTLAGHASAVFNALLPSCLPEKIGKYPIFDCRMYPLPSVDAGNAFLWREQDAMRNSVSMLAQYYFSHKKLIGKSTVDKIDMLRAQKAVIWDDCPDFFKHGTYIKRVGRVKVNPEYPDQPTIRHAIEVIPGNLTSMPSFADRHAFVVSNEWADYPVELMGS